MNKYTYYVDGCGVEVSVVAATQKDAHDAAWGCLTDEQRDNAKSLDWIDTEDASK